MERPTFVMTVWPSLWATKSLTLLGGALASLLPPMKWSARLCFSAYEALPLTTGTVRPFVVASAMMWCMGDEEEDVASEEMECRERIGRGRSRRKLSRQAVMNPWEDKRFEVIRKGGISTSRWGGKGSCGCATPTTYTTR